MRIAIAVLVVGLTLVPAAARADAPAPETYWFRQPEAGTVTIYLNDYSGRTCPDQGLLRRKVGTDEVVKITSCADDLRFIDQCVPAGEYEYGLAVPLECHESAGTERYSTLTVAVSDGAAEGCTRSVGDPAPVSATDVSGWDAGPWVCERHYPGMPDCSTGGGVMGLNVALLGAGLALWRWRPGRRRA